MDFSTFNLAQGLYSVLMGACVGGFIFGGTVIVQRFLADRKLSRWNRELNEPSAFTEPEDSGDGA